MTVYWLLELTIDGRVYRWSSPTGVVLDDDTEYQPGLSALTSALGMDSQPVVISDPSIDWPLLATEIDGGTATLRRWDGEHQPVTYVSGEARLTSYGTRQDPVEVQIVRRPGSTLGTRVPDPLARVSSDTWPDGGTGVGVVLGDEGRAYPVILGYPGWNAEAVSLTPVVPVPLAQWFTSESGTFVIVAEDGSQAIDSVKILNQATGGFHLETAASTRDQLGRLVRYAFFSSNSSAYPVSPNDSRDLYAAYGPTIGGGGPRSAYDVLVYLLRRWGPGSVDWSRLPEIRDRLAPYLIDTWIDDSQGTPWDWFQGTILGELPFEVRSSERGLYLVERRYVADGSRRVGVLDVDNGDAAIEGVCELSADGPTNEFVGQFRPGREGDWLGQVLLTGADGLTSAASTGVDVKTTVVRSGLCSASLARYGPRPLESPVQIDWTWDLGTMLLVLQRKVEALAFPARLVTYRLGPEGADLLEGDEVTLTDTAHGFDGIGAIVDGPPEVGSATVSVQLRIPRAA